MKKIKLCYTVTQTKTFDIPKSWKSYFNAFEKEEDELTDSEYDLLNSKSLEDFIKEVTGNTFYIDDIEIIGYR